MATPYTGPFPPGSLVADLGGSRLAVWDGGAWVLARRPQSIPGASVRGVGPLAGVTWDGSRWVSANGAGNGAMVVRPAAAEGGDVPWWKQGLTIVHEVGTVVAAGYGLKPFADTAGNYWRGLGLIT